MPTILLADDHSFCCELFSLVVQQGGYTVLTARNGYDALKLMRSQVVNLVLLDVHMPQLDGISTLRVMRADARLGKIPVILLTAEEDRDYVRQSAQLGVQGYVLKSQFALKDLMARIDKLLAASPQRVSVGKGATALSFEERLAAARHGAGQLPTSVQVVSE